MKGAQNTNRTQHHQKKSTLYLCVSQLLSTYIAPKMASFSSLLVIRYDTIKSFFLKTPHTSTKLVWLVYMNYDTNVFCEKIITMDVIRIMTSFSDTQSTEAYTIYWGYIEVHKLYSYILILLTLSARRGFENFNFFLNKKIRTKPSISPSKNGCMTYVLCSNASEWPLVFKNGKTGFIA